MVVRTGSQVLVVVAMVTVLLVVIVLVVIGLLVVMVLVLEPASPRVPLMEESFIDLKEKTITLYTRSVGYGTFMTAIEKVRLLVVVVVVLVVLVVVLTPPPAQVVYKADPSNPSHTVALKQAWVESNFYGLRSAIKTFGIERFKKNCRNATDGFNHVLERFHHKQHDLRELGTVKLAEFQVRREQLREDIKERGIHLKEDIKERGIHLKEGVTERVGQVKDGVTGTVELVKEKSKGMKEVVKEAAEEMKERVKAQAEA